MLIRTGLLTVGLLDEEAITIITDVLRKGLPGVQVLQTQAVGSQRHWVADTLMRWCDEEEMDLVVTLGGTLPAPGPSSAEITPEATGDVLERPLPAFSESMRNYAAQETRLALLDRSVAGIRGRTVILNLPAGTATPVLFLNGVIDLLPALLAHLGDHGAAPVAEDELLIVADAAPLADEGVGVDAPGEPTGRLNAEEFEAFRRRRRHD